MVVVMLMGFSIGVVQADNCVLPVFDVANFTSQNDNPYLSTDNIGYTYVYEAETEDGLIRDYIYFSEDTVNILGVECTVVYDVEYLFVEDLGVSGEWVLLEETWDWHAWDQFGNFWYFGEDTVAYEWDEDWGDCETSTEGAWKAGVNGAEAGIILPFDPNQGDCFYEEYYEGEAEDQARVMKLNAKVSWALGECEDCGKFKEWTKLDPGNIEHKYYAPGLGLVYIEELKEKTVISELADHYPGGPDLTGMDLYSVPCYEPLP
jgi:hypothetical protein